MENIELFKGIKEGGLDSLLGYLQAKPYVFNKDKKIYKQGDKITDIAIVLVGEVKLTTTNLDGSENILGFAQHGETFCANYAYSKEKITEVNAITTKQTGVLFLPFERIIKFNESTALWQTLLMKNLFDSMAQENVKNNQRLSFLEKKTIREKMLSYLNFEAAKAKSGWFEVSLSREEMAEYLCVDRCALSRELSNMQKEGLLEYRKNEFKLFSAN